MGVIYNRSFTYCALIQHYQKDKKTPNPVAVVRSLEFQALRLQLLVLLLAIWKELSNNECKDIFCILFLHEAELM